MGRREKPPSLFFACRANDRYQNFDEKQKSKILLAIFPGFVIIITTVF
ncbi:MAG: hypothetical protein SPG04_02265 [Candidatus Heritagella sp.]|nr:hypothetical protein [Candidatus Heritagella sp.]